MFRLLILVLLTFSFSAIGPDVSAHEKHAQKAAAAETTAPDTPAASGMMADHVMPPGAVTEPAEPPKSMAARVANWIGRWHPSMVHFPIALLLTAALLEMYALARRKTSMLETIRILVALGSLGALVAVGLGWLSMGLSIGADDALHQIHRWLGTAIGVLAMATWWAHERFAKVRGTRAGALYGSLLAATVIAILVNGYFGGALVHGVNHLRL